jgi:hypothetical protein
MVTLDFSVVNPGTKIQEDFALKNGLPDKVPRRTFLLTMI